MRVIAVCPDYSVNSVENHNRIAIGSNLTRIFLNKDLAAGFRINGLSPVRSCRDLHNLAGDYNTIAENAFGVEAVILALELQIIETDKRSAVRIACETLHNFGGLDAMVSNIDLGEPLYIKLAACRNADGIKS